MDRTAALAALPQAHAVALRLREAGAGVELIARALGIDPDAVAPLLDVAEAKLRGLLAAGPHDRPL